MGYLIRRQLTNEEQARFGGVSPLVAHLLFHRGITSKEAAEQFMVPDYDRDTHDPFLLKDADRAAARIIQAIEKKEKVVVYADYDADGIPAAAVFDQLFKKIGFKNYSVYIPHRHDEGFGLNIDAVNEFAEKEVDLVVTVDCGITDRAALQSAKEKGIDVIVTDHHEPPAEGLPPAYAVVDPKRDDCEYPDKNLCGAGVAFKLLQAILAKKDFGIKPGWEKWLLDLVGLATLSDMVPLTGENRVFAYYGLKVLQKSPRNGLRRLLERLKISQKHITEDDIAFMITPRINAASRMGVPVDAFNLLVADDDADATKYAERLDAVNAERKAAVAVLVKEVKKTIKERYGIHASAALAGENSPPRERACLARRSQAEAGDETEELLSPRERGISSSPLPFVIVLGNPSWRPSLLGLAANTCATEFRRPVFLWGRDGSGEIKGSCRSEGVTHVVSIMRAVPAGVLTQYGGHKHSGGFTVCGEQVHYLDKHLNDACASNEENAKVGSAELESEESSESSVDAELTLGQVDWKLHEEIAKLAPFGVGNRKPIFLFKNVTPFAVRRFGKAKEHVGLDFRQSNGVKIVAISFFGVENEWVSEVETGKAIDLVASLEKSLWRDTPELRLRIVDVINRP